MKKCKKTKSIFSRRYANERLLGSVNALSERVQKRAKRTWGASEEEEVVSTILQRLGRGNARLQNVLEAQKDRRG